MQQLKIIRHLLGDKGDKIDVLYIPHIKYTVLNHNIKNALYAIKFFKRLFALDRSDQLNVLRAERSQVLFIGSR